MNFSHLVSLAHSLASKGFLCLRFTCKGLNLVYRVKAYRAVWRYLKSLPNWTVKNMFFGGRSMGCRAAAALAKQLSDESEGAVQGVVCLSFPLHPPGQTHAHQQRSEDLRRLPENMAVLFVSGTEDNMCDRVLFEGTLKKMSAQVDVFWLSGGSHGLKVVGRSEESVLEEQSEMTSSGLASLTNQSAITDPAEFVLKTGALILTHILSLQSSRRTPPPFPPPNIQDRWVCFCQSPAQRTSVRNGFRGPSGFDLVRNNYTETKTHFYQCLVRHLFCFPQHSSVVSKTSTYQ
ncbi:testis-expressed protein 30 isoform X3 [Hippocampus zosterae]|nr:testis-expressed protein 30 isoform X3 [Hippocampus zosterae]